MCINNDKISEEFKRIVYAGVGVAVAATEAFNDLFNTLSDKGEEYMNKNKGSDGNSANANRSFDNQNQSNANPNQSFSGDNPNSSRNQGCNRSNADSGEDCEGF